MSRFNQRSDGISLGHQLHPCRLDFCRSFYLAIHAPPPPCASHQAYEILELFMELLAVRAPLVASSKEIPRDMVEALSSVLYCASR